MKWSTVATATVMMVAPLLFSSTAAAKDEKKPITLRGCVQPGADKGTFLLTHVTEQPGLGESTMPEYAHGRRVVFWLKDLKDLRGHVGHMAEVRGVLTGFKESEIELKNRKGRIYAELEGPGKDIKVDNSVAGAAIGTAGRTVGDKKDIKTMLAIVDVKDVKLDPGTCQ